RRQPDAPVDQLGGPAAQHEADAEGLRLVREPSARRLVRQFVAPLEKKAAVETKRQAGDFVEEREQEDVAEDRRTGLPGHRSDAAGYPFGSVPERRTPSGPDQAAKQQGAP